MASMTDRLHEAGISNLWPRTDDETGADLLERVRGARRHITMFGLTRNFYARYDVLPLVEARAAAIPVTFFAMDPYCDSRRDRYRLEPVDAALGDPGRYVREVLRPLHAAGERVAPAAADGAGLRVFLYNFPCSFAIEQIDEVCRVMLYGHGRRGTDSPIFVFEAGNPCYDYFRSQIDWIRLLASDPPQQWVDKGLVVRPLEPSDLADRPPPEPAPKDPPTTA